MRKRALLVPWWLEDGTELCPFCHHLYIYETEHRCSKCDQASCEHCGSFHTTNCSHCAEDDSLDIELEI